MHTYSNNTKNRAKVFRYLATLVPKQRKTSTIKTSLAHNVVNYKVLGIASRKNKTPTSKSERNVYRNM